MPPKWCFCSRPPPASTALTVVPTVRARTSMKRTVMAPSRLLNTDESCRQEPTEAAAKLLPLQVGSKGQLQKWYLDFEDVDPHHRHTSHLYALYPANEISPL